LRKDRHSLKHVRENGENLPPKRSGSFGVLGLVRQFHLALRLGCPKEEGGGGGGGGEVDGKSEFRRKYGGAELHEDADGESIRGLRFEVWIVGGDLSATTKGRPRRTRLHMR
jgi:hypothetical protein